MYLQKYIRCFDEEIEILDCGIINTWLEVDQSMNIVFNEKKDKRVFK